MGIRDVMEWKGTELAVLVLNIKANVCTIGLRTHWSRSLIQNSSSVLQAECHNIFKNRTQRPRSSCLYIRMSHILFIQMVWFRCFWKVRICVLNFLFYCLFLIDSVLWGNQHRLSGPDLQRGVWHRLSKPVGALAKLLPFFHCLLWVSAHTSRKINLLTAAINYIFITHM